MDIRKTRSLRYIRRFNFHNCNHYMTVAEHSFYVALIAEQIGRDMMLSASELLTVVQMALHHDIEEAITGDIGYLVKKHFDVGTMEDLASQELGIEFKSVRKCYDKRYQPIVEFADCIELKFYLEEERRSGNMSLYDIERETMGRMYTIRFDDIDVKELWLKKVEIVKPKKIPEYMTHEGE